MRQKRKTLSIVLCVVLILAATVTGTLAYFTDSDSATNTFTVGKVGITLTETSENGEGENHVLGTKKTGEGENGYEYTLIPGLTYAKKPVVTITEGSEDAYVRMLVTFNKHDALCAVYGKTKLTETGLLDWDTTVWEFVPNDAKNAAGVYEFRYKTTVNDKSGSEGNGVLEALFTRVQMPGEANNQQLQDLKDLSITVEAHAIQAAGFKTADEAWTAFDVQHPTT